MNGTGALPSPPLPSLVTDDAELEELAARWSSCAAIALDTEFVRTRTYFPKLGLIQVSDPEALYLVDTVAIQRFEPLVELLVDTSTVKILHSPSEDLEVFQHAFDLIPAPLYDTQISATLAGLGSTLSYQALVFELFGVELPKQQQRSNWMRRPLTPEQIQYASLDVAYLLPAHELLEKRIARLGRGDWLVEELATLVADARERLDPMRIVRRLLRSTMSPLQASTLERLVLWREQEAADRDLPRNFVIREDALIELARQRPETPRALAKMRLLGSRERNRYREVLLQLVDEASRSPGSGEGVESASAPRGRRRNVNELREVVSKVADELDLPPEFVAKRRWLEELANNFRSGRRELPTGLRGWREAAIGSRLLSELESNDGKPS